MADEREESPKLNIQSEPYNPTATIANVVQTAKRMSQAVRKSTGLPPDVRMG
jgi:hypothetical protein